MRDSPVLRLGLVAAVTVLSGSLTLTACGGAGNEDDVSPPDGRTPLVIDTDMAVDGIMSTLFLLAQEDLDVRAITVSGTGMVHGEAGAAQALGLLELAEAGDIPVAYGPEQPLTGTNAFPSGWRTAADGSYGVVLPEGGDVSARTAPELIVQTIEESAEPVVVYNAGPLTNLAAALRLEPGIAEDISMVWTMGGTLDAAGTTERNKDAEWNIWVDPTAAAEVLASGVPMTLVPLDATNQVPLNVFHQRALEQHADSPAAATTIALLKGNEALSAGGLYFWDPLTAALVVDETLADFETATMAVTEGEPNEAGITSRVEDGAEVRIVTTVDAERFEREFLSALAGTDVGPISREIDMTATFDGEEWTFDGPEELALGDYLVAFTNSGTHEAGVAAGWISGDATEEDVLSWTSITQPPFLELDGFAWGGPGTWVSAIVLTEVGTHYMEGLNSSTMTATNIGQFEVSE